MSADYFRFDSCRCELEGGGSKRGWSFLSFPFHFTSQNMASSTQTTTTTTQQWILNKYSRSRTAPDPRIKRQKLSEIKDKNASKPAGKQEFDHL